MTALLQDLRYALRAMRNSPGFAAVAIVTIALAIGANTAIFSFVDGMLLSPLPYAEPDRIVPVLEKRPDGGRNGISTLNHLDWAEQNTVFEYMAAQTGWAATLTGGDEPVRIRGSRDPLTIAVVAIVLIAVAAVACLIPARRVTKVDPMVALRYQ